MSQFSYSAIRGSGQRISGTLRSRDRREAVRKLMEMGCHPVSVEATAGSAGSPKDVRRILLRWRYRVRTTDLAVFTRQLSSLLKAGLPVVRALATLRKQVEHPGLEEVIEQLERSLTQDAMSLAEAMEDHPDVFDPVYVGLVRSGEEGGRLVEVLARLATHLSKSAVLRGQVIGAFIYPLFLLLVGVLAVVVLMIFVIPKFQDLFASMDQQLPGPTALLIATSAFFETWWWAMLLACVGVVVVAATAMRQARVREAFDAMLLRTPVLGAMTLKLEIARVAHTLAALVQGGVRLMDAMTVAGRTARNAVVRRSFPAMAQAIAEGGTLADAAEKTTIYPPMVVNLIRTGEETGELPEMLQELSAIYEEEAERAVNGAVKLLEPLLIVLMGALIAGIVAAVILPIFQQGAMTS